MEYLLKIYSNQNSSIPYNVVENINNISFNRDLNDFSTLEIELPINISWMRQFNKIELCTVWDWEDIVEFWWYIHSIKPSLSKISLECRDSKALLLYKILISDKDFTWVSISSAMNSILWEWNTETNESWTFSTNSVATITKKFSEWDNFFDILDDLWELLKCVRKIEWNTIIFNETLWEDKSVPENPNFFELVYNGDDLNENNIDTIETETYWTQANLIIWKSWTLKQRVKDATSITEIWCFAEYKLFREWNLASQINEYLSLKKNEQRSFLIKWKKDVWNELNIWDKIHIRVEWINEYMNIETNVFVLWKQVSIENGTKIINLTLSEIYATVDSFTKKINRIQKDVKFLSL